MIVTPLYAGGRFLTKTLTANVQCGGTWLISNWLEHFTEHSQGERCWLDGAGVEFFPPWEAWTFLIALLAVLLPWGVAVRKLTKQ